MWVPGTFTDLGGVNWIWASGCDCTHFQISEDVVKTRGRHKVGVGLNFNRGYWHSTPDKDNVVGVFLSDDKDDFKATLLEQGGTKIVMKVPQTKAGGYNVSIQVKDRILILPIKFSVTE